MSFDYFVVMTVIQVQCQLFCSKKIYCDFIVWTEKDVHIERIYPNEEFWLRNVEKVKHFFITSILPELMGTFYSRTSHSVQHGVEPQEPCQSGTSSLLAEDTTMNTANDEHIVIVMDRKKEKWWDATIQTVYTDGFISSV